MMTVNYSDDELNDGFPPDFDAKKSKLHGSCVSMEQAGGFDDYNIARLGTITHKTKPVFICIGQILMDFGDADKSLRSGTGTVIKTLPNHHFLVLTCAHNVVQYLKIAKRMEEPKKIWFLPQGCALFGCRLQLVHKVVYNKYKPELSLCPHDLAIVLFHDKKGSEGRGSQYYDDVDVNKVIQVSEWKNGEESDMHLFGYPTKSKGLLQGQSGEAQLNRKRGLWLYEDISTYPGQSGAAIFKRIRKNEYGVYGIHTFGDTANQKNCGVFLDTEKRKWIQSVADDCKLIAISNEPKESKAKTWLKNTNLPENVINKLIKAGFDNMDAIKCITNKDLEDIEIKRGHRKQIIGYVRQLKPIKYDHKRDLAENTKSWLSDVVGLDEKETQILFDEGYDNMDALQRLNEDDLKEIYIKRGHIGQIMYFVRRLPQQSLEVKEVPQFDVIPQPPPQIVIEVKQKDAIVMYDGKHSGAKTGSHDTRPYVVNNIDERYEAGMALGSPESADLRMICLGFNGSGASSLMLKCAYNEFNQEPSENKLLTWDHHQFQYEYESSIFRISISDLNGFDSSISKNEMKKCIEKALPYANVVLLLYSIASIESFEGDYSVQDIKQHLDEILSLSNERKIVLLIATKRDLSKKRTVSEERGQTLAYKWEIPFFEISSKTGNNMTGILDQICDIYKYDNGGNYPLYLPYHLETNDIIVDNVVETYDSDGQLPDITIEDRQDEEPSMASNNNSFPPHQSTCVLVLKDFTIFSLPTIPPIYTNRIASNVWKEFTDAIIQRINQTYAQNNNMTNLAQIRRRLQIAYWVYTPLTCIFGYSAYFSFIALPTSLGGTVALKLLVGITLALGALASLITAILTVTQCGKLMKEYRYSCQQDVEAAFNCMNQKYNNAMYLTSARSTHRNNGTVQLGICVVLKVQNVEQNMAMQNMDKLISTKKKTKTIASIDSKSN